MNECIENGLIAEGILEGGLNVKEELQRYIKCSQKAGKETLLKQWILLMYMQWL